MNKEMCCIDCDHIFEAEDALTCENCGSENIEELPPGYDSVDDASMEDGHYEGQFNGDVADRSYDHEEG